MDVRNGHIYAAEQVAEMTDEERRHLSPMLTDPTPAQLARGRVGRNDPCPCGSGKKFKHCHLSRMGYPRRDPEAERSYAGRIGMG